jgi:hypothetical protein
VKYSQDLKETDNMKFKNILTEAKDLFFDCTKNYMGKKDNYWCIKYGSLHSCGYYKGTSDYRKEWEGEKTFGGGEVNWNIQNRQTLEIKGYKWFKLTIWEENSHFELVIGYEDEEYGRFLGGIIFSGVFECGSKKELLFKDIVIIEVGFRDLSGGGDGKHVTDKNNAKLKKFVNQVLTKSKHLKLVGVDKNPLTGDEMRHDIEQIME